MYSVLSGLEKDIFIFVYIFPYYNLRSCQSGSEAAYQTRQPFDARRACGGIRLYDDGLTAFYLQNIFGVETKDVYDGLCSSIMSIQFIIGLLCLLIPINKIEDLPKPQPALGKQSKLEFSPPTPLFFLSSFTQLLLPEECSEPNRHGQLE